MRRKTISVDDLDNFSIDTETRQLFWCDKEIVTVFSLPRYAQILGIGAAVSTIAIGAVTVAGALFAIGRYFL